MREKCYEIIRSECSDFPAACRRTCVMGVPLAELGSALLPGSAGQPRCRTAYAAVSRYTAPRVSRRDVSRGAALDNQRRGRPALRSCAPLRSGLTHKSRSANLTWLISPLLNLDQSPSLFLHGKPLFRVSLLDKGLCKVPERSMLCLPGWGKRSLQLRQRSRPSLNGSLQSRCTARVPPNRGLDACSHFHLGGHPAQPSKRICFFP